MKLDCPCTGSLTSRVWGNDYDESHGSLKTETLVGRLMICINIQNMDFYQQQKKLSEISLVHLHQLSPKVFDLKTIKCHPSEGTACKAQRASIFSFD